MSNRPEPIVTPEHTERAYAQLRRPDWPPLDEMARWARQYAVITARASSLAHGQTLPPEPNAASVPVSSDRRTDAEMREATRGALRCGTCGGYSRVCTACHGTGRQKAPLQPTRRRDDFIDLKSRAAGERDDE